MKKTPYEHALSQVGTREIKGARHNPDVVNYFAEAGAPWVHDDETAWCAAFVGAMLKRGGVEGTGALNARSYLDWGVPVRLGEARPGDVIVLWRGSQSSWQGHVGFYVRQEGDNIVILGGNQGNAVTEARYPVDRLLGVRRVPKLSPRTPRTSPAQSRTLQAAGIGGITSMGGIVSSLSYLDGQTQKIMLAMAFVILLAFAWIARERIKKWLDGDH